MKIVIPIKQILDPAGLTFRRDKERMFVNREEYIIDPASKAALEAALRLKDAGGTQAIAISVGAPRAGDALREALALGCDEAYLLNDAAHAAAFSEADASGAARILAAAIVKLGGADLVVAGRRSADTGAGQIGPRLAAALGYAQVVDAYALEAKEGALQAIRAWGEPGAFARVEVALPAVVTVAPEAFPARYAHGARIMSAYREWEVPTWDAADLDLDPAALKPLLVKRGEGFPPPLETEEFQGEPATVAQEAVMALRLQKLIG